MQVVDNQRSIWSVAYSPDGSQLAYGGELADLQDIAAQITIIPAVTLTATPALTPTAAP
jgi:hypothetical protein